VLVLKEKESFPFEFVFSQQPSFYSFEGNSFLRAKINYFKTDVVSLVLTYSAPMLPSPTIKNLLLNDFYIVFFVFLNPLVT
jgi:hypothetical protein